MTNFNNWTRSDRSFSRLRHDPHNSRLVGDGLSTAEIIEQMVAAEDVEEMAKRIVREGYMGVDSLIAVVEGGKTVVVEGNRRLTALMLLRDPMKAPPAKRKTFERLSKAIGENLPDKVSVVIAPNRAEANVYVFSKHSVKGGFDRGF